MSMRACLYCAYKAAFCRSLAFSLLFLGLNFMIFGTASAWSDGPPKIMRQPNQPFPVRGSLFKAPEGSLSDFLLDGNWVEFTALGDAGQDYLDDLVGKGELSPHTYGFFEADSEYRKFLRLRREPSKFVVGTRGVVNTRMHELGHLWIETIRQSFGLPEISNELEEVILTGSHLSNPRRLYLMSSKERRNTYLYLRNSMNAMHSDEVKRLPELLPKFTRRHAELLHESSFLGKFYQERLARIENWSVVKSMDERFLAHAQLKRIPSNFDLSVGPLAVLEAASLGLDFSGHQIANLGAKFDHLDLIIAGALVSSFGQALYPLNGGAEPISLQHAMTTSRFASREGKTAADVIIGRDETMAGHIQSEAAMNKKVGHHPGWCRYSCSAGCPNSYARPKLPWRMWHGIFGGPASGSEYDKRVLCPQ